MDRSPTSMRAAIARAGAWFREGLAGDAGGLFATASEAGNSRGNAGRSDAGHGLRRTRCSPVLSSRSRAARAVRQRFTTRRRCVDECVWHEPRGPSHLRPARGRGGIPARGQRGPVRSHVRMGRLARLDGVRVGSARERRVVRCAEQARVSTAWPSCAARSVTSFPSPRSR